MSMENVLESLAVKLGRAEIQQIILEQSLSKSNEVNTELQNTLNDRDQSLQEQTAEIESLKSKLAEFLPPTGQLQEKEEAPEDFPEESNEAE